MLGKGQHTLNIELVQPVLVELDIDEDLLLADPVHLATVALRVEGLLVDERFDQALLALLDAELAFLPDLFELLDLGLPVLPDLEDRLSQGLQVLGLRLQLVQELEEERFEPILGDAHAGAARAAVVGIASPSLATRPATRQGPLASCAAHEATQRKVGVIPVVPRLGGTDSREDSLNAVEEGRVD